MKCLSLDQAERRYGSINLETGVWPNANQWLRMFIVTPGDFPNWKVMSTNEPVTHFLLNSDAHEPLRLALTAVKDRGYAAILMTFDGAFNVRRVRGRHEVSTHAYGLSIDLNADENPLGAQHGQFFYHPEFVKCFTDYKFSWGGSFDGRKDDMHFSYGWE